MPSLPDLYAKTQADLDASERTNVILKAVEAELNRRGWHLPSGGRIVVHGIGRDWQTGNRVMRWCFVAAHRMPITEEQRKWLKRTWDWKQYHPKSSFDCGGYITVNWNQDSVDVETMENVPAGYLLRNLRRNLDGARQKEFLDHNNQMYAAELLDKMGIPDLWRPDGNNRIERTESMPEHLL